VLKLLKRPFVLALLLELFDFALSEFSKQFHVERGIRQPAVGKRPGGPVLVGMLLGEGQPEEVRGDVGKVHALNTEQARRDFGVEDCRRS
jgi:hypothetical protein